MADKINVETEITLLVPITVKAGLLLRINHGADVAKALKTWSNGRQPATTDIEDVELESALRIGSTEVDQEEDFADQVMTYIKDQVETDGVKFKLAETVVTDAR